MVRKRSSENFLGWFLYEGFLIFLKPIHGVVVLWLTRSGSWRLPIASIGEIWPAILVRLLFINVWKTNFLSHSSLLRVWPSNIVVRAGELDFRKPSKAFPFVERVVIDNISHPKYASRPGSISDFDIGLLRLERPIRFQPHISPICLPGTEDVFPGDEATVAGWGKTEYHESATKLRKVSKNSYRHFCVSNKINAN